MVKIAVQVQIHARGSEEAGATGDKHGTQNVFYIRTLAQPA
jgi:hypothetical protein